MKQKYVIAQYATDDSEELTIWHDSYDTPAQAAESVINYLSEIYETAYTDEATTMNELGETGTYCYENNVFCVSEINI